MFAPKTIAARRPARRRGRSLAHLFALLGLAAIAASSPARAQTDRVILKGNVNPVIGYATPVRPMAADTRVQLTLSLPLPNPDALTAKIRQLYATDSLEQGRYLTAQAFAAQFSPSQADYDAVTAFARAAGLEVIKTHDNRILLNVAGSVATIEQAFGVHMMEYVLADGTVFHGPDGEPSVPAALAGKMMGVIGLDDFTQFQPHFREGPSAGTGLTSSLTPNGIGTGPSGNLAPADIKAAYNLTDTTLTGSGQTLALFELDGFLLSDINNYENTFGLPHVPIFVEAVDGFSGVPLPPVPKKQVGQDEVTLDIELATALAPNINKIIVYEAPNAGGSILDLYNQIAMDNSAQQISTSWGSPENTSSSSFYATELQIFEEFAAQGQSFYAASGDSGAFDLAVLGPGFGSSASVDDPASNPFVTAAGGTRLATNGVGGPWSAETSWGNFTNRSGGGGGISTNWFLPPWQQGLISPASLGSPVFRNVPDVSLNADPRSGYAIFSRGGWKNFGGTSCAAPLWAAFTALVNQQRTINAAPVLGFASPALYQIARGPHYTIDFHDIADGSTNLLFPAVPGYDASTGLGSFNGLNLLLNLAGSEQLIVDPGLENGNNSAPWVATDNVILPSGNPAAHSGGWFAWLGGYGQVHTDYLAQTVMIPASASSATLTFWLHIDTAETSTVTAYDTLKVQIRDTNGVVLQTPVTFSNLNHNTGYVKQTVNLSAFIGQKVYIDFHETEDGSNQTSFFLDDFSLVVK